MYIGMLEVVFENLGTHSSQGFHSIKNYRFYFKTWTKNMNWWQDHVLVGRTFRPDIIPWIQVSAHLTT